MDHANVISSLSTYLQGRSFLSDFVVMDEEPDDIKIIETNLIWLKAGIINITGSKDYSMGNPREVFGVEIGIVTPQNQFEGMDADLLGTTILQVKEGLLNDKIPYYVGDQISGRNIEVTSCMVRVDNQSEAKMEIVLE